MIQRLQKFIAILLWWGLCGTFASGVFVVYVVATGLSWSDDLTGHVVPMSVPRSGFFPRQVFITATQDKVLSILSAHLVMLVCGLAGLGTLDLYEGCLRNPPAVLWKDFQSSQRISVSRAVLIGSIWIKVPTYLLLITFGGLAAFIYIKVSNSDWIKPIFRGLQDPTLGIAFIVFLLGVHVVLAIAPACLYWASSCRHWIAWSLRKVQDIDDLKREALRRGLISSERSWRRHLKHLAYAEAPKSRPSAPTD